MQFVAGIADLIMLVVLILVLIKQFQKGGMLQGIIGLVTCGLWTFIWGWMHAKEQNITNLMWILTGLCVLIAVLSVLNTQAAGSVEAPTSFLRSLI